jgi:3,4-dihydroxy 2-butanone 4-phosphate synthase / GTP cyclohydrolase II
MAVRETIEVVRKFAGERKLRPATLARLAGLHPNTLRGMNEPDWSPSLATIEKLEEFMSRQPERVAS